jgi:signal transduction histidine kinase
MDQLAGFHPDNSSADGMNSSTGLRWYRSLYWRIALGLFAFLALMLTAQGALFLWMTDRIAGSMPARSPRRLAELVAFDVSAALDANPGLDLQAYLPEQYGETLQTFVVIMRDGRTFSNHDDVPEALLEAVREEQRFMDDGPRRFGRRGGPGPPREGEPPPGPPRSPDDMGPPPRRPPPPRRGEFVPVFVRGMPVGRVMVLPGGPSFWRIVTRLGPTMAPVAAGVLGVGMMVIAFVVFGPTRRRLKAVQEATQRLGTGDLDARAPDSGGDEVAAVARSFNNMAAELTSRARALERSDGARRQLLADVSHELMTPLTAMRGYIETLAMPELQLDSPTRERYLQIATDETHRLERIIGDLLDLARLEGGGTSMRRERVDVNALFRRVAARHERELRERGIRLLTHVVPGAERVNGDPDRLEQALQNLAANALRHVPEGAEIHLTSSLVAEGSMLTVRDTGPGIPKEHLPLIFERFYKADAARKAAGGSGLGLSIVKAIVERHGGRIGARNENGAVFEIVLPSDRAEPASPSQEIFEPRPVHPL